MLHCGMRSNEMKKEKERKNEEIEITMISLSICLDSSQTASFLVVHKRLIVISEREKKSFAISISLPSSHSPTLLLCFHSLPIKYGISIFLATIPFVVMNLHKNQR